MLRSGRFLEIGGGTGQELSNTHFLESCLGWRGVLVEANPILTEISDCMTAEGKAVDAADADAAEGWARRKEAANDALAECSKKYNTLMGAMREAGW